ncbi:hypothetical protein OG960_00645 [Streptomyces sp. NBC_00280]
MPVLLEGRTIDQVTWMHTPENIARFAAFELEADARGRAVPEQQSEQPSTDAVGPADQRRHQNRNSRGRGRTRALKEDRPAVHGVQCVADLLVKARNPVGEKRFAANDQQSTHRTEWFGVTCGLGRSGLTGRAGRVVLTINLAVLLAVIIVMRLRRRTHARSRNDEKLTVVIVLVFGVLIAPTAFGQTVFDVVGQLAQGVTQSGSP